MDFNLHTLDFNITVLFIFLVLLLKLIYFIIDLFRDLNFLFPFILSDYADFIGSLISILIIIICVLVSVAFLTLLERKILAAMQRRRGPNIVGFFGLLQPFVDGFKLIIKETIILLVSNKILFIIAPILTLFVSLSNWSVIPFDFNNIVSDVNIGILYLFGLSTLGVYGLIIAGWSSNSKYSFLGSVRSAAQMVSYEISLSLIVMSILLCCSSLKLNDVIFMQKYVWFFFFLFPIASMFYVSIIAETNRPPFDLPEAEAELVAGYNVEYSAIGFAFFQIAEYSSIIMMSVLYLTLFLGGYVYLGYKIIFLVFSFVWIRVAFPRYRYDQLMYLTWQTFLPCALAAIVLVGGFLVFLY